MPATVLPGFVPYLAFMVKDVGARLAIMGHYLQTGRHMYPVMRHQNVRAYRGLLPWTQDCAFIAPSAFVCGNVVLGHDACIFYHAVIRNYHGSEETVVGDHTVVMDRASFLGQVRVGQGVYIGPGTTLDCCSIGDGAYIGPGASVALGAVVENGAIVAAGAHLPKDVRVHAWELWAGNPAQKVAEVTQEQAGEVAHLVHEQIAAAKAHAQAIHDHLRRTEELDAEWLHEALTAMEKQQQQVTLKVPVDIPLEAKRFLEPRVHMRRPEMHMRMSYPVNRVAPWMPKVADQTANA
ncbi:gamma carbonic dehydratase [Trypanosoma grayi]|uniref:gamma carbonic dehydratase n=1 Tax=Trypanosoma grayi TaxID=71804 RepID=UPI0004F49488|nr:gamma carbonic dehydratase [Trypanosoma grayi]KEG06259.1 gamma carbonic dehydratase [Trypanosoma grayi]